MYILPDARGAYTHWWEAQVATYALWFAYRHLNIPALDYMPRVPYKRYQSSRTRTVTVQHTITMPTGEEIIYQWESPHYTYGRWWQKRKQSDFRKSQHFIQHGIEKKEIDQLKADWREHKGFQRDRIKARHQYRNTKWARKQMNKEARQAARQMIHHERWDRISKKDDPFDWWRID